MAQRTKHLVVIGTSAGGIETLRTIVGGLPSDFAAAICVVMHTPPDSPGVLAGILSRVGPLPAIAARRAERLQPGHIYVAPPDCHLVIEPGIVRPTKGPRENLFRPAVDPLFRSAAQVYGPAAIGVVLSGNLDDGTAGLWAIKRLGGTAIVQDPDDALFDGMPRSAIDRVAIDHVVPAAAIPPLLVRLTSTALPETGEIVVPEPIKIEVDIAREANPVDAGLTKIADPSSFACPECHGVLLQMKNEGRLRFRCHTGHAYSIDTLLAAMGEAVDDSMWNSIRALEEAGLFMSTVAEHLKAHNAEQAAQLEARARQVREQSTRLREMAAMREPLPADR
jgi:two-component system chemotaxis response regulator CheB